VLIWTAIPALGKQWRLEAGVNVDHQLIQTGPYRYLRHPIYASMLALLLATSALIARPRPFLLAIVLFVAGTEIRVRAEDRLLAARFGDRFTQYRCRVRAYVPWLR
jgi:protein-S-isoprenylcysteine O-methyltransferase Ste14